MIEITQGDILKAEAEALVNTVNCVGVMGRGIALQFRKAFPENFKAYKAACDRKELWMGKVFVYDLGRLSNPRCVINFPTKRDWRGKSRLEDVEAGLKSLAEEVCKWNIKSIAIPPLGCGLGGLNWHEVRPMIERIFGSLPDVHVLLFEPKGAPVAGKMTREKKRPRMTIGRSVLLGLMRRYLAGMMDASITLLEIHKLMYFMQEAGEHLRLRYRKAPYGPYAENLRHVLSHIEGHFITGYGDAEDAPDKEIELKPGPVQKAEAFLDNHADTRARFDRVVDLIKGFETPFGMELLSTVHWVVTREGVTTMEGVIAKTYEWNDRKRMFKEEHIRIAQDVLRRKGWFAEG